MRFGRWGTLEAGTRYNSRKNQTTMDYTPAKTKVKGSTGNPPVIPATLEAANGFQ
jgi:hypothetical protein